MQAGVKGKLGRLLGIFEVSLLKFSWEYILENWCVLRGKRKQI